MKDMHDPREFFDQELSFEIWDTNYKGPDDKTVEDTRNRQAVAAASVEKEDVKEYWENEFKWLLENGRGSGGGRITANLGIKEREGTTLMNCFVFDGAPMDDVPLDSMAGIYNQLSKAAHTLKSEGGYGHNFSYIRPNGTYIHGIGSRTPGVIHFMGLWNETSRVITMGSEKVIGGRKKEEKKKIRKGAMMGVLDASHPDIEEFIDAKLQAGVLDKFNLSVGISDKFMDALMNNEDWDLRFPDTTFEKYDKEWNGNIDDWEDKGYPVVVYKTIKAQYLWDKIMTSTYKRNEPGVLFLGLANKLNTIPYAESIRASNPCGEILMSTGVCNLFSINLPKFYTKEYSFNWDEFKRAIWAAVRFSDNINDISRVPLDEYKKSMQEKRRIGVGTLGIGSLLYMMGIPFSSEEGLNMMKKIAKFKAEQELLASATFGKEKGSFKLFDRDKYFNSYLWNNLKIDEDIKNQIKAIGEMRNSHHSANAPTGNMSIYLGMISGGIEPVFSKEYNRFSTVVEGDRIKLKEKGFKFPDVFIGEWFETEHLKFTMRGNEQILRGEFDGVVYEVDKSRGLTKQTRVVDYGYKWCEDNLTPEEFEEYEKRGVFQTSETLSADDHLNSLEIFAHYTSMNNSKTINLPEDYSYEDFKHIYMSAYEKNIKGTTTYRAGTMTAVMESIKDEQDDVEEAFDNEGVIQEDVKLPDEFYTKGYVIRDRNRKKWYVNIGFANEKRTKPFAIFVTSNHSETTEVTEETKEALIKLAKESGIKDKFITSTVNKIKHNSNVQAIARMLSLLLRHNIPIADIVRVLDEGNYPLSSFTFHIKRLLKQFIPNGVSTGKTCSECGGELVMQEGCYICPQCGNSKCG